MHTLQKMLDGTWAPAVKYTASQLLAVTDENLVSRERVKLAWMNAPQVQAFLKNACIITALDAMAQAYLDHLEDMPVFESMARAARNRDGTTPTGAQLEASEPPTWYQLYLRTEHWGSIRRRASRHYGGCVLCGETDEQECHHRHYRSLGKEALTDVSILCSSHHKIVRGYLGIRVPKICPDNVDSMLRRCGLK